MRGLCIELLHYITEAIDNNASDNEINSRIEEVANREDIIEKTINESLGLGNP